MTSNKRFKFSVQDKEQIKIFLDEIVKNYPIEDDESKLPYILAGTKNDYNYVVVGDILDKLKKKYWEEYKQVQNYESKDFMSESTFINYLREHKKKHIEKKKAKSNSNNFRKLLRETLKDNVVSICLEEDIRYQFKLSKKEKKILINENKENENIVVENVYYVVFIDFSDFSIHLANQVAELIYYIFNDIKYIEINMGAIRIYTHSKNKALKILETIDFYNSFKILNVKYDI